ncbi:hypothetical protein [Nocardioides insulae]|uniref:hypothetical protein n=1 Tax=Nocardioides insulae TaxID=394734 RepID=UPI00041AC308|nr:hypothetical protein [Nocardioides insulae]
MQSSARRLLAATAALGVVVGLGACSGEDDGGEAASPTPTPSTTPAPIATNLKIGVVTGKLPRAQRQQASAAVGKVVDGWLDAAYLGTYPSTRPQLASASFRGFTKGAAAQASRQAQLTTNAAIAGTIDGATAKRRIVKVDLFAPKGKPVAARANVAMVFDTTGEAEQRRRVNARLDLTKVEGTWRVFAFDVSNTAVPAGRGKAGGPSAGNPGSSASSSPSTSAAPGAATSSEESQ